MDQINKIKKLEVSQILKRFGGINDLRQRLLNKGVDINTKTIEKWRERKQIPSWRLLQLIALAKQEGEPLDVLEFISL
ncbi:MAG: hypothetical protein EBS09_12065 [Flavobacteriia bacterium]|nr:hypothetical protein [Flavobacteriia bacterium]